MVLNLPLTYLRHLPRGTNSTTSQSSSPHWTQSNGQAEAAVKSARHILLTADDVDLVLLSV